MDTLQPQTDRTVTVDTPSLRLIILSLWIPYNLRLIEQSQWTLPASDSVDTLQPQIDQTVPVDILNLGLIIHIGLLTTSD